MSFHCTLLNAKSASSAWTRKPTCARRFVWLKVAVWCPMEHHDLSAKAKCSITSWAAQRSPSTPSCLKFPSARSTTKRHWTRFASWAVELQPDTVQLWTQLELSQEALALFGVLVLLDWLLSWAARQLELVASSASTSILTSLGWPSNLEQQKSSIQKTSTSPFKSTLLK